MSYATERDAFGRTPQAILSIGLPRCENFYATPVKQLLQYTEDFSNAIWTKSGVTVTAGGITNGPDGLAGGYTLTAAAPNDYVEQVATGYAAASATYVFSVFASMSGAGTFKLQIRDSTGSQIGEATFTLTTSWTRCSLQFQFTGAATGDVRVRIVKLDTNFSHWFWGANLTKNPVNNNALALFPYVKRTNEADTVIATMASRCQAADKGDGARCTFNLVSGCQDPANYNAGNSWVYPVFERFPFDSNGDPKNGIREFKFSRKLAPLPFKGGALIRPLLSSWDQAPQEINASRVAIGKDSDGGFLTRNEEASYTLEDDADPGVWDQDKASIGGLINTAKGGGSFWLRLLAIHPNFDNPRGYARLSTGFVFAGSTEADYQLRLSGPIRRIKVGAGNIATVEATDILIVTKRKIPSQISTSNYLVESINAAVTQFNVADPDEISDPAPNAADPETFSNGQRSHGPDWVVTLVLGGTEKVNVISKTNGGNPLTVQRGRWGTAAAAHLSHSPFTEIREFGTEQTTPQNPVLGANPIDIKMALFREAGIGWALSNSPHEGIDINFHYQQRSTWAFSYLDPTLATEGGILFRQTVTEPTSIDDLLRSVDRDLVSFQYVDDNRHVRTRIFAPPTPTETLIELTDISHFCEVPLVETDMDARLSRVACGWDLIPGRTGDVLGDYAKQALSVDPAAEAPDAHGTVRDLIILSKWMRPGDPHRGLATAARIRARFARGTRFLTGVLEAKDDDNVTLGTFVYVTTAQIQTPTGAIDGKKIMLAISKKRGPEQGRMTIRFIDAGFSGRLLFWQDAAGAPADYDSATDEQRRFGFWADANGKVDASLAEPYLWG